MEKLLNKQLTLSIFILFTSFFLINPYALAYQVQPMSAEIKPVGKQSQYSLRVDNTDSFPVSLEFIPWLVTQDEFGKNTLSPADNDLLVIPMTAVVQPGKSQTIMVRYLGEPVIEQSQTYSIEINQVTVAMEDVSASELGIAFNFKTMLNVTPDDSKAELNAKSFQSHGDTWNIEVVNSGNRFAKITEMEWVVSDGNHSVTLDRDNIKDFVVGKMVMPNASRIFTVSQIDKIDMANASVKIKWLQQ